jgi:flagellar hook-basal body complex protein FliE
MSPIGSVNLFSTPALTRPDAVPPKISLPPVPTNIAGPQEGFGSMLDGLVGSVEAKRAAAQAETRKVLLGDSDQLHQSVIAMQEASVAFTMMVEVRNKLVESYQELMRMQV